MAIAAVSLSERLRRPGVHHKFAYPLQSLVGLESEPKSNTPTEREVSPILQNRKNAPQSGRKGRGRRPKGSWKWREKRVDLEFDLVIVPSDGISMSGSDSEDSDWSVGWFEPHHTDFTDNELEDSFAVLVPCYGSPSPQFTGPSRNGIEGAHPPVWTSVLANMARHPSAEDKQHVERWLARL